MIVAVQEPAMACAEAGLVPPPQSGGPPPTPHQRQAQAE